MMATTKNDKLIEEMTPYFRRRHDPVLPKLSTNNVSSPPTDTELDTAFGIPANLPEPFLAVVNDNNAGTALWLVCAAGGFWWHVAFTKAV